MTRLEVVFMMATGSPRPALRMALPMTARFTPPT